MKKILLLGLFLVAPCYANGVPTWSTGSSNRTENTTQTITRTQVTEKYGSALNTWEASNISVAASAGISGGDAVLAEKILAINVGSKSTIFLPDGGSQYESVNNAADHRSTQTLTMVSTLLGS